MIEAEISISIVKKSFIIVIQLFELDCIHTVSKHSSADEAIEIKTKITHCQTVRVFIL